MAQIEECKLAWEKEKYGKEVSMAVAIQDKKFDREAELMNQKYEKDISMAVTIQDKKFDREAELIDRRYEKEMGLKKLDVISTLAQQGKTPQEIREFLKLASET